MTSPGVCRDTFGLFNSSGFSLWTCSLCFTYLFPSSTFFIFNHDRENPGIYINKSGGNEYVYRDVRDKNRLCSSVNEPDCKRWQTCCEAASSCCKKQLSNTFKRDSNTHCPLTWDGFSCVDRTAAGTVSNIKCPDFYTQYGLSSGYATKRCTANGTWWIDPRSHREWTDYSPCLDVKNLKTLPYVGIISCSISLMLLIPACVIFLSIRQLRSQKRVRLHTCLFISFVLTCIAEIVWDLLVYNDRLDNPISSSRMNQNTVLCRVIYSLKRYCRTCNFFWMFCEGFYLQRLLNHAFRVPRTLFWYYVIGWGGPCLPILIYVSVRLHTADSGCWVKHIGVFEWIIYIPNLFCILLNFIFLCSILKIILTGLQTHPNEPNNYRRCLKATFLLVPLFGLQLFLITYRPSAENSHRLLYEIISKIIIDSQGAIVSLIFFYMNTEVHVSIKHRFLLSGLNLPCVQIKQHNSRNLSLTNISSLRPTVPKKENYKIIKPKSTVKINDEVREFVFS